MCYDHAKVLAAIDDKAPLHQVSTPVHHCRSAKPPLFPCRFHLIPHSHKHLSIAILDSKPGLSGRPFHSRHNTARLSIDNLVVKERCLPQDL